MRRLLLLAALLLAPAAAATPGPAGAPEREVLLLDDERTRVVELTGGYDLGRVSLGEAHLPQVGSGAAGDGFYFRATLHGDLSSPLAAPARVVFAFDTPGGRTERWLETGDGRTFTTDFDALLVEPAADRIEIRLAFVSYASVGVVPGATLSGFRVTSLSGDEPRDVAPGGIFLPGPLGAVELESGPSRVITAEHALEGVGGYATVQVAEESVGVFAVTVTSLLEAREQHVRLGEVGPQPGWTVEPLGETAAVLAPGASYAFRLRLYADAPESALRLDVLTDAGGRVGLVADNADNVLTLKPERVEPVGLSAAPPSAPVPLPLLVPLSAFAGAAALARRRR